MKVPLTKAQVLYALSLGLALLVAPSVNARLHRSYTFEELRQRADVIVVGSPVSVTLTAERSPLPDIRVVAPSGRETAVIGKGLETTFDVLTTLKGDATIKRLVLHHYALEDSRSENGPGLLAFDVARRRTYLLFLTRSADGRYRAVSGQTDPDISIREIGPMQPGP